MAILWKGWERGLRPFFAAKPPHLAGNYFGVNETLDGEDGSEDVFDEIET